MNYHKHHSKNEHDGCNRYNIFSNQVIFYITFMVIILFVIFIVAMIENYFTKLFCLYFLHSQEFLTYKT